MNKQLSGGFWRARRWLATSASETPAQATSGHLRPGSLLGPQRGSVRKVKIERGTQQQL